jgi:CDP-diglyceride synthetase
MLRTRLATAAVAIPALWAFIVYAPVWLFACFIVVVTAIGLAEYFAMALPEHQPERVAGTVFGLVVAMGVVMRDPNLWGAGVSLTLVAGLAFPLFRNHDLGAAVNRVGLQILGVLYVGFFMPHAALVRELDGGEGWRWLLFTLGAVFGSDTGGYFAGRFLGRRKLLPEVSPKKTVEGAIGAIVAAVGSAHASAGAAAVGRAPGGRRGDRHERARAARRPGRIRAEARLRGKRLRLDYPRSRWHLGSAGQPALPVRVRLLLRGRRRSLRLTDGHPGSRRHDDRIHRGARRARVRA